MAMPATDISAIVPEGPVVEPTAARLPAPFH